jgi:hypothetical protein
MSNEDMFREEKKMKSKKKCKGRKAPSKLKPKFTPVGATK